LKNEVSAGEMMLQAEAFDIMIWLPVVPSVVCAVVPSTLRSVTVGASTVVVEAWVAADVVSSTWVVWVTVLSVTGVVVNSVVSWGCKCVTDTCIGTAVVASVATDELPSVCVLPVKAVVLASVSVSADVVETSIIDIYKLWWPVIFLKVFQICKWCIFTGLDFIWKCLCI